ncbi:hypothetical protein JW926_10545 [Candidatus Sumerlaeota bacterium]|nr:hypothetical protein [Candidatus Sumerlaeota bacterium]
MVKIARIMMFLMFFHFPGRLLGEETISQKNTVHFIADFPEDKQKAAEFFLELGEKAVQFFKDQGFDPPQDKVSLVYCATQKDFLQKSGLNPEHIVACASPERRAIFINGEQFQILKKEDIQPVMIHEYAHIYLGLKVAASLPLWLNEGLAMHLAGEWSFGDSVNLSLAHVMNRFIPFSQLSENFPYGKSEMRIAYLQSYSMTDFIMKNFFGKGGLNPFLKRLERPNESFEIISRLQDPIILKSLEVQWRNHLGARWRNILYIILSGSLTWFFITLLFLYAYYKKRKQKKEQEALWEEEYQ